MTLTSKLWRPELTQAHKVFLDSISQEAEAVLQKEKEEACQSLHQQIAQLQQTLEAESTKLRVAKAQHAVAMRKQASRHAKEAKEWETMLIRHSSDSKLFKFAVRGLSGNPFSGSVPRSIFAAEPDSALAQIYDGEWEYAKDEEGCAIVHSDPANWPLILNWLSFGTVPSTPSESLLSECRYWQLDRLLAAIDAKENTDTGITQEVAGSHRLNIKRMTVAGNDGFTISGQIFDFPERFASATASKAQSVKLPYPSLRFAAAGRKWKMEIKEAGFSVSLLTLPLLTTSMWEVILGSGPLAVKKSYAHALPFQWARTLQWNAGELNRILQPRTLSVEGSLQLTMTLAFEDTK